MPERWSDLIHSIAQKSGARGGILMCAKQDLNLRLCSPDIEDIVDDYEREGWAQNNVRTAGLAARQPYAGFLSDAATQSAEALTTLPVYRDFLIPRGMAAGNATIIQGAAGDGIVLTVEGFESHHEAELATDFLDSLRPHLARAAVLSGQLSLKQAQIAVDALAIMGTAAAMLDFEGKVMAANHLFARELEQRLGDGRHRLRATDKTSDDALAQAIHKMSVSKQGSSLAIRDASRQSPIVLHLVPVAGDARDVFALAAGLAIVATADNGALPNSDLLQSLFDLTPTEARIARAVGGARTVQEIAAEQNVAVETVRSHLKRVLSKTGKNRQSELAILVKQQAPPLTDK